MYSTPLWCPSKCQVTLGGADLVGVAWITRLAVGSVAARAALLPSTSRAIKPPHNNPILDLLPKVLTSAGRGRRSKRLLELIMPAL
jgi:hypothetical protein